MSAYTPSAGAVELRNNLAQRWEVELPATLVFDHPSIASLTAYLVEKVVPTRMLPSVALDGGATEARAPEQHGHATELVAVSGRYPGTSSHMMSGFSDTVSCSGNLQTVIPLNRWDMDEVYTPELSAGRMGINARFGATCRGVDLFDAGAFRLAATEAVAIDPQVR